MVEAVEFMDVSLYTPGLYFIAPQFLLNHPLYAIYVAPDVFHSAKALNGWNPHEYGAHKSTTAIREGYGSWRVSMGPRSRVAICRRGFEENESIIPARRLALQLLVS